MVAPSLLAPLMRPVLWFSKDERQRRRGLKTLAVLQSRSLTVRSDIAALDERTVVAARRLTDERRSFTEVHDVLQSTEADLQKVLAQMGAVGVKPHVTMKLGADPASPQLSSQSSVLQPLPQP